MSFSKKICQHTLLGARDACRWFYNQVLLRLSAPLANYIYECLPHRLLRYLLAHQVIGPTKQSFLWKLKLRNSQSLCVIVSPVDPFTAALAFEYKAHDVGLKRTQEFFIDRLSPRALYLDIGANIGVSSIYALSANHPCWLFEPNEALHATGQKLFADNSFSRARWLNVALSDNEGAASFFISKSTFLSSFERGNAEQEGAAREITVPKRRLDSYLEEIKSLADELLIKIDVEGHELSVLDGAREIVAAYRPVILIEVLAKESDRKCAWNWLCVNEYKCVGIYDEPELRVKLLRDIQSFETFADINFALIPSGHRLLEAYLINDKR